MLIDKAKAIKLLHKYADKNPKNISSCTYVRNGEAECLIGQILINDIGIPIDFFLYNGHNGCSIGKLSEKISDKVTFTDDAYRLFWNAQSYQDDGLPWEEVVALAKESLDNESSI